MPPSREAPSTASACVRRARATAGTSRTGSMGEPIVSAASCRTRASSISRPSPTGRRAVVSEWELGGPPFERPEDYERFSPHRFVSRWKTPPLVSVGELDFRTTVDHGYAAFTALQRRGIPSKLLAFPRRGA